MNGRGRDALLILLEAVATLVVAYGAIRMQGEDPLEGLWHWWADHRPLELNYRQLEAWRKRFELGLVGGAEDGE